MTATFDKDQNETFALVEVMASPAALCDASGRFIAVNPRFAVHFSVQNKSLLGQHIADVWDPNEKAALLEYLEGLPKTKPKLRGLSCAQLTLRPLQTAEGIRLIAQVEEQGRDDPLLRFFLAEVDQAYWEYDVREDLFTVSEAWREMRGIGPDEDVNDAKKDWLEDVHPDDVAHLKSRITAQASGKEKSINIQYRRKHLVTQEWLWLMCRATVVEYDQHDAPLRIIGTDNDISEIKKGEADLERLNKKIDLAIEASGIGIWEFDSDKAQVHWDDRLLAIYGLEAGNNFQTGDFWEACIHPDDREITVACATESARTKEDLVHDFRIVRPSGEVRHIRTMARYVDVSALHTKLVGVNIDVTADVLHAQELERARKQLEFDSRHDALTGLANRRYLDELLLEFSQTLSEGHNICVMHLDLDHFKNINDTLGHAAGDAVLVHVATALRKFIADQGTIFRMGGDEFAVVFETAPSQTTLEHLAQDIIQALKVPLDYNGHACRFGVSIGAANGSGRLALDNNIFSKADIALYAAKSAGRSCFRMYSTRKHANSTTTLKRRQDLLDAIADGTIKMWYQPQYDTITQQMSGAEALARIENPERGTLNPKDFLPLAKELGLLSQVEGAILRRVLADQTIWFNDGLDYPRIAINISADWLANPAMIDDLIAQLEDHHAIGFELLETAFLDDPGAVTLSNLEHLRALKIPIELDDFGSGHASILALTAIRPSTVKIDRALVKDIPWSEEALALLRAAIAVAGVMKSRVILEGIEGQDHFDIARTLDCHALQGFGLCRPLKADDFSQMLATGSGPALKVGQTAS